MISTITKDDDNIISLLKPTAPIEDKAARLTSIRMLIDGTLKLSEVVNNIEAVNKLQKALARREVKAAVDAGILSIEDDLKNKWLSKWAPLYLLEY
jgi:hypothetical protein